MKLEAPVEKRDLKTDHVASDLVIVGGGMAGTCCAITAARLGLKVTLVQDRPVLGGNASSEVRLWILGATSHMGNNNRWAREGGVIDEILVDNLYRNPEGNPLIFDTILLEKVVAEPNIRLLLNTAAFEVAKQDADTIESVRAICSQNSTSYVLSAPLFVDASGDGIVGFLSGAAFRMGAERKEEFGEKLAPEETYGELLGHSLYFYSKDTGRPVQYIPPSFALADITTIPRFRSFNTKEHGCRLWWIEYGGRLDTVHDTEKIKWELWKIVYGVWNHIKNSGNFPEAENLTLEWVGHIPGKRESRRFEGDVMLTQQDIIEQRLHPDAVAHGGWAVDLHPADAIYSELPPCNQWHSRGVYQIPYRCLYSRNVRNLFLAGRIISTSHVAFGSTRVQATLSAAAQAVAVAAAHCQAEEAYPRDMLEPTHMISLQRDLLRLGQFIPNVVLHDRDDMAQAAHISASSVLALSELPPDGEYLALEYSWAQMLPVNPGRLPHFTFFADATAPTTLIVELRTSNRPSNYTPDVILGSREISLTPGEAELELDFNLPVDEARYVFLTFQKNPHVCLRTSKQRLTGLLSVANKYNKAVANSSRQEPPAGLDIGIESFEFWTPQRRPNGHNLALRIEPALHVFAEENVINGLARPTNAPNAWVADYHDPKPSLTLSWQKPFALRQVELSFDTDFDHPLETVLMGHPENAMPFCVKTYRVLANEQELAFVTDNHQTRRIHTLSEPIITDCLTVELLETRGGVPPALFEIRCYT
ncbi:MAG TPA: FAD-dependent oxidoreductase [Anaerolineales bacterium]|nr:FAD-dependent oxidoreductase [Anaerolineales bacterium]